jgi:hypothetical protein
MPRLKCPKCLKTANASLGTACRDCGLTMQPTAISKPPSGKPSIPHKRYRKGTGKRLSK